MRLAANISFLFSELDPLARIVAAREVGFEGVELLFPYELDPRALRRTAAAERMTIVQINSPPGNRDAAEMGFAALPGREADFQESCKLALAYLGELGCSQLHLLAGVPQAHCSPDAIRAVYVRNLQWAADLAAAQGVRLMIEPLNSRDFPGYALATLAQAADILATVARQNVGLQFDLYHSQIMGGDLSFRLRQFAHLIQHVQIAGAPDRNEPDRGEVNLGRVLQVLRETGYDRWVSAEYRPASTTRAGLEWLAIVAKVLAGHDN